MKMEPKLDEIAKAVKFLTDCGIDTMLRENKPTIASMPSKVFLKMFSTYEKTFLSDSPFGFVVMLKTVHNGIEYRTYAYLYEINKGA